MASPPIVPDADTLDGSETVRVRQKGMIRKITVSLLKGLKGDAGAAGSKGDKGDAGINAFGLPTTRTLALATAYQATTTARPAQVTVTLQATSSISLSGASNNEGEIVIGTANTVATGTGTKIATYKNNLGGGLVVGLNLTSTQANTYSFSLPAGGFFAIRQTSGTGLTITSAFDQAVG